MSFHRSLPCTALALLLAAAPTWAQPAPPVDWPALGEVQPRHARDIAASNWSVGAETMDRAYTVYANWRDYLGPLGVKKARLQGGWARTEPEPGVYDFRWLDEIVYDMAEQGVEPWIMLGYGNPAYRAGDQLVSSGLPQTPEALAAWDRWVRLMVARYGDVVDEWEVWNEPLHQDITAEDYARFLVRTAETVKSVQPEATVIALAMAGASARKADAVLGAVADAGKLHLVDALTYHPYRANPDAVYGEVAELRRVVERHAPHIELRQGENGAPSERQTSRALRNMDWSETAQAKWALRRLLGDLGRGIPSSYFGIADMHYPDEPNRKGLLLMNDDQTVARPKAAYHAVQHLTAVFTDALDRIPHVTYEAGTDASLSVFAHEAGPGGPQAWTLWIDAEKPTDEEATTPVDLTLYGGRFDEPVWVDLRTGAVHAIPEAQWSRRGNTYRFEGVPLYDSPVLIADRRLVPMAATTSAR